MRNVTTTNRLTHRQAEILRYVTEYIDQMGMPPTHGEIAEHFGLKSTYGVRQHLRLIQQKGHLDLVRRKARGIKVPETFLPGQGHEIQEIHLIGRIAAGKPILVLENIEDSFSVGVGVFHGNNLFALRVQGDSMVNAGITDGDIAIIDQQPQVENGDIAAVVLDDEATLKQVILEPNCVRLKAANDYYPDIVITSKKNQNFRIVGRFVGLIRQQGAKKSFRNNLTS